MWSCKSCGGEVFEVQTKSKESVYKLDKDGYSYELVYKDKHSSSSNTSYRCDNCYNESDWLSDIAEWVEE